MRLVLLAFLLAPDFYASTSVAILPLVFEGPQGVWQPSLIYGLLAAVTVKALFFKISSPFKLGFSTFAAVCVSLPSLFCGLLLTALFLDSQTAILALILLPYFLQKSSQGLVGLKICSGFSPVYFSVTLMGIILLGLCAHDQALYRGFALAYLGLSFFLSIFLEERAMVFLQTDEKVAFNTLPLLFRANALILAIGLLIWENMLDFRVWL